jgi:hypothetical protein
MPGRRGANPIGFARIDHDLFEGCKQDRDREHDTVVPAVTMLGSLAQAERHQCMDDVIEQRLTNHAAWIAREHRNMEWAEVFDLLDRIEPASRPRFISLVCRQLSAANRQCFTSLLTADDGSSCGSEEPSTGAAAMIQFGNTPDWVRRRLTAPLLTRRNGR